MEPHELAVQVNSKETFLVFLKSLHDDWEASIAVERAQSSSPYGPSARGWENPDLGRFLEAMHAWMEDNERIGTHPSWRTFADMLMAAKIYE
jgi:hypothetical protein